MKGKKLGLVLLGLALLLAGCGSPGTLTIMTHDSFDVSEDVINAFQESCNCEVQFLKSGDTGLMLNQALLSKDNPLADVIYGVDNSFLSRALAGDILEPYESPALTDVPDDLELDPTHHMLPVDYGDVCLNYDKGWFKERDLAPPADLPDLVQPEYKGLTVVENPATSSPGLAFLLATIGRFGETGDYAYLDYWADLKANDVLVTDGWEDAYWGSFTYASDGDRPIVVSYASSPPVEVYFAEAEFDEAPTGCGRGRRQLLPPGRVCRHPERHQEPGPGRTVGGLYAGHHLPGGHPAQDVRLSGQQPGRAARRLCPLCRDP